MTDSEQDASYKTLMAGSGAAAAGSAGALAIYQGHIPEGIEYASQAKDMLSPIFYDPEMTKSGASNLKEHAIGNVDTLMHFMSGAGLSGLANKVLEPGNRTKALATGLAGGALGYTMLKEGMYEGAFSTIDLSVNSIKNAAHPADHVMGELNDLDYNADQKRDVKADTAGVMTERSLSSTPSYSSIDQKEVLEEPEPAQSEIDELIEKQNGVWNPDVAGQAGSAGPEASMDTGPAVGSTQAAD